MELNYKFEEGFWNYEVEHERVVNALITIFARTYEIDIDKAREIYNDDWVKFEDLKEQYQEELKDFFEKEAYNNYLEVRFA